MSKIAKLDQHTINSIAAGEVIDRPASVVKELVDNALDAGAETIRVDIAAGGVREIRVRDDGTGMSPDDALLAVQSHTTSKLRSVDDLDRLTSMGFRGEALASIAAVSRLSLTTREIGSEEGFRIELEGGRQTLAGPHGGSEGTLITVRDLFYNTPARYKFLKSDIAEAAQVTERLGHLALTRPDVSFQLERDGKTVLHTPGNHDLLSAIFAVFGSDTAAGMEPVEHAEAPISVSGYMSKPAQARNNRSRQVFIVNGRVIRSRVLQIAVEEACSTYFMKGRHPALVFHIALPPMYVDINVHPQKSEVRFWDDKKVFSAVYHAVRRTLERDERQQPDVQRTPPSAEPEPRPEPEQVTWPLTRTAPSVPTLPVPVPAATEPPSKRLPETAPDPVPAPAREISALLEGKILGQFLNTYIVLQVADALVLVDQHAAHERILYERLCRTPLGGESGYGRQPLLLPAEVAVTPAEAAYLEANPGRLGELGFDLEPFGPSVYILRSAPDLGRPINPGKLFSEWLAALCDNHFNEDAGFRDAFALRACKAAVKANQAMSLPEMEHLLQELQALENPYHCPHGRPIAVTLTKAEIEKRFGRIV